MASKFASKLASNGSAAAAGGGGGGGATDGGLERGGEDVDEVDDVDVLRGFDVVEGGAAAGLVFWGGTMMGFGAMGGGAGGATVGR